MTSDPLARSDIWTGPLNESDYNAVYAAVTATERGRWFLNEFANRNCHADTDLLVAAIARIESVVRTDAASQSSESPPVEDASVAAIESATPAINDNAAGTEVPTDDDDLSLSRSFSGKLQENEKLANAVAVIADEATSALVETEKPPEPQTQSADAIMPPANFEETHVPPPQLRADYAPRWIIEPPDFVFDLTDRKAAAACAETPKEVEPARSQLPGPQPPGPEDDPAELFESPPSRIAIMPASAPVSAEQTPSPPLRVANGGNGMSRNISRAAPVDALAAIRGLSEDELIALFG
jgi:hypothetical protein